MRYVFIVLSYLASPSRLLACSVCGVYGEDVSNTPFLQGTALLSLMPLIVIGSTVYYIYRRHKRLQAEDVAGPITVQAMPLPRLGADPQ